MSTPDDESTPVEDAIYSSSTDLVNVLHEIRDLLKELIKREKK